jgi:hypothetical protein
MDWFELDTVELRNRLMRKRTVEGSEAQFAPSPYDIPNALRCFNTPDGAYLIVEFRYLNQEKTTKLAIAEELAVEVGVNSGRIYRLIISLLALTNQRQPLDLESVLMGSMAKIRARFSEIAGTAQPRSVISQYELPQQALLQSRPRWSPELIRCS